jgi:hypothetical protein
MGFGALPDFPEWFKALARWYRRRTEMTEQPQYPADTASDDFLRKWNDRAHLAYNVYGDSVGWKNYQGLRMPTWDELPRRIRASWCLTTEALHANVKATCREAVEDATHSWEWIPERGDILAAIDMVE